MPMSVYDIIKRYFISGVIIVVPIILTYIVLKFLFEAIDGILQPILFELLGYSVPGLGFITTILLVILTGALTRNYVGHRLYKLGDSILERIPVTRPIYSAAKQLLEAITSTSSRSFKEVGLVEYPRKGAYALCFISKRLKIQTESGFEERVSVFVPSTPTPVSGTVIMVPPNELVLLEMTIEEGLKFLVSGGVASPDLLKVRNRNSSAADKEIINETG